MRATPDVARAGPTSARRRRERRIRSFFRHEQMAIRMAVVSAQHHSAQRCCSVATQTADEVPATTAASPMVEYVDPAPVAPAPVIGYVAPAPSVTYAAPASVIEYVAPAPVFGYFAPAPAVTPSVPGQQLRPGVNSDVTGTVYPHFSSSAVDGFASKVVGSLSLGDVFAAPVFHQVHQEQLAGDDVISRVAHSLPVEEFTEPVYNPVHQQHCSAGDTTENIADFPVVHEQVIVGMRPERLVDARRPQGGAGACGLPAL